MVTPALDTQIQYYSFKGLNINMPPDLIADEELAVAKNILIRKGRIKKRPGAELVTDFSFGVYGKLYFMGIDTGYGTGNAVFYFYDVDNFNIYASTSLTSLTERSGVAAINFVSSVLLDSDALGTQGPYFLGSVGGVDGIYQLIQNFGPGANPTLVSGNVSGFSGSIFTYQDRMWWYGARDLVFSEPGDYTTIDATSENSVTLPSNIDAAYPIGDKIVLSTAEGIFILTIQGSPRNWSLTKISNTYRGYIITETTRTKSMVQLDQELYFLTPEGLFVTDGTKVQKLSEPIETEFDQATRSFPDSVNIGIFSVRNKELLIKIPGNFQDGGNNQLKYYIYSILEGTWTKLELGFLTPGGAPIFLPASNHDGLAFYTYDLISFNHLYAETTLSYPAPWTNAATGQAVTNFSNELQGLYAMSNWNTNEPNKLYRFPEFEENWDYLDGAIAFISTVRTKTFDLGYRGAHKKIVKEFFSVDVPTTLTLNFTHIVNNVVGSPITKSITPTTRNVKHGGPGYFLEYAMEISDTAVENDGWELQTMSFDIVNKSEQSANSGV